MWGAIAQSCNVYFYQVGGGNPEVSEQTLRRGIAYIVERADSPDESWTAASPVNEILSDNGVVQRIKAKVPTNEPLRTFLRLRVAH